MSADILSNGKLSYANAVSTGGIGHDISGQDGLFSQHSVVVHTSRALLAAVNVSYYRLNDPKVLTLRRYVIRLDRTQCLCLV